MKKIVILSMCLTAFLFAEQNNENSACGNINVLKAAVSKLITEQEKIKLNIVDQQKEINELKEKLNQKENKIVEQKLKEMPVKIGAKHSCETKKVKEVNKEQIKYSFFKMNEKEFKIMTDKALVYEDPVLESNSIREYSRGEVFIGDMYTVAGWVHDKNGGWLKGYILSPKVEYDKNAVFNSKNSAYIEKEIVDCTGEK